MVAMFDSIIFAGLCNGDLSGPTPNMKRERKASKVLFAVNPGYGL